MFQSSPGPKAGRCLLTTLDGLRSRIVSILARPEGRALQLRALSVLRSA